MYNVRRFERFSPSAAAAAVCAGLAFAPDSLIHALTWDRDEIGAGQWWRLWTGHLVHYSLRHALLDATVALLLGVIMEKHFTRRIVAAVWLLGAPAISLALWWLVPDLVEYRGASAIATLLGVLSGAALWSSTQRYRILLVTLATIFCAKTACDVLAFQITLTALPEHVAVAWQAHVLGVVVAIVVWMYCSRDHVREAFR